MPALLLFATCRPDSALPNKRDAAIEGNKRATADESDSVVMRSRQELSMVLVDSVNPPDSVTLIDARISGEGSIAAWGASRGIWLYRNRRWKQLGRNIRMPIGARFVEGDSVLEVVDRLRSAVVAVGADGSYKTKKSFVVNHSIEGAAAIGTDWFVVGSDVEGDFVLTTLLGHERRSLSQVVWRRGSSAKTFSARISAVDTQVLITEFDAPFRVFIANATTRVDSLTPLPDTLQLRMERDGQARWGALSMVVLPDQGLLQTFTDLRGDQRLFVLRDRNGNFTRSRSMPVPLTLLHSEPSSRLVLGARRASRTQFVVYRLSKRN